jgi:hypothetical protein
MKNICVLLLVLLLGLQAPSVFANERINSLITSLLGQILPASTLFDNTDHGTRGLKVPGWIISDAEDQFGFGLVFTSGASEYRLKALTMLVGSLPAEPTFEGSVEVRLYQASEIEDIPSGSPLWVKRLEGQKIEARPQYITVPLDGVLIKRNTRYAVVLASYNAYGARIMGFQVPDVAPTSAEGITPGSPFWGNDKGGWRRLLNPYIWLEGWNLDSAQTSKTVKSYLGFGLTITFISLAVIVWASLKLRAGKC